jgi:hypothetical protein
MTIGLKIKDKKEFECVICGTPIKECGSGYDDNDWLEAAVLDGNVVKCSAGYGSVYDGDVFYLAICDKCVDEKKDRIEFVGDYMAGINRDSDNFEEHNDYFKQRHKK